MPLQPDLTDRERQVLEAVIQSYVETAEPAASRTIVLLGHIDTVPGNIPVRIESPADGDLLFGEAPHAHDHVAQAPQLLLVAPHRVLRHLSRDPPGHPKRPVMYSCVRLSRGAVKSCAAGATSTSSPR